MTCKTCGPDGCSDRVACPRAAISDAVQQAAEAVGPEGVRDALRTDRSEPAAPRAQEPVAWRVEWRNWTCYYDKSDPLPAEWECEQEATVIPLYAAPQPAAAPRQPLTDEQILSLCRSVGIDGYDERIVFARAIERDHSIGAEGGAA